jgi:4-hydroxy-2-oxoheptanedioate aldolase
MSWANDEIFVAIQIESVRAAEQAEQILAVDGIDGCWIGPGDLSMSMGVDLATEKGREAHEALILQVFEACKRVNKIPGIYTPSASEALRRADQGGLFMTSGGDGPWVVEGAKETLRQLGRLD